MPTTADVAAILASAGLVLTIVAFARRIHSPESTRRGRWALALLGMAIFCGGAGLGAADLWRERSGLAWGDLLPLGLESDGGPIPDATQASLLRRLRAERVSEIDAKRMIEQFRSSESGLEPELISLLKRAAWNETDILRWMGDDLPRLLRATRENPASPEVRLTLLPFDPLRLDTPPIDPSWLEAECLHATLDGAPLAVRSPLGDDVPQRGAAIDAPWSIAVPSATAASHSLSMRWRFTLRWRPSGDVEWIDYMDPTLRKSVSVEAVLTASGASLDALEWSVMR